MESEKALIGPSPQRVCCSCRNCLSFRFPKRPRGLGIRTLRNRFFFSTRTPQQVAFGSLLPINKLLETMLGVSWVSLRTIILAACHYVDFHCQVAVDHLAERSAYSKLNLAYIPECKKCFFRHPVLIFFYNKRPLTCEKHQQIPCRKQSEICCCCFFEVFFVSYLRPSPRSCKDLREQRRPVAHGALDH